MNTRRIATVFAFVLASTSSRAASTTLSPRDTDFLSKATTTGIKEVEMSRMAQTRALDAHVRAIADAMVIQHGGANDALTKLALDNKWTMPTQLDAEAQSALSKLQERQGKEFDTEYIKDMKQDHVEAVKLFRDAAQNLDNPILRDYARTTLPTLENHQTMVKDL